MSCWHLSFATGGGRYLAEEAPARGGQVAHLRALRTTESVETLAIFGVSLFLFALLERVINALVCVFVGAKSDGKSLRAQLLVEGAINLISVAQNTSIPQLEGCWWPH